MYEEKRIQVDSSGYSTTATEARQPQVQESMEMLSESVDVARKMLDELETRLSPVLRSEPQATGCAAPKDAPTVVALAGRANEIAQRVRFLGDKIGSIGRRLEV